MSEPRSLFVIDLTYTAPLEEVDALIGRHMASLDRGYAEGVFLVSGRKNPRTGGVIIAVGNARHAIEARVTTDPFVEEGVAEATVTESLPGNAAPEDLRTLLAMPAN